MAKRRSIRDDDLVDYHVKRRVFSGRTRFQDVIIADTREWGRVLLLDGSTQSSEYDEYIYHEALVHPAMISHGRPRSVLIIGGGEGATLREVLAYPTVERVVMVDLDRELVELCAMHMPQWSRGAFEDKRTELVFADGKTFIESCEESFDVILIDLVDTLDKGPAAALYEKRFYRKVRSKLRSGGMLVLQAMRMSGAEAPMNHDHLKVRKRLSKLFPVVRTYLAFVPSFWSEWAFILATDGTDPLALSRNQIDQRLAKPCPAGQPNLGSYLRYYDADAHWRMFTHTKDLKRLLGILDPAQGTTA